MGGYSDWADKGGSLTALDESARAGDESRRPAAEKPAQPKKLSYKDQRELDALPARIEQLETRKAELEQEAAEPSFYQQEQQAVKALLDELAAIAGELESAYARWDELES